MVAHYLPAYGQAYTLSTLLGREERCEQVVGDDVQDHLIQRGILTAALRVSVMEAEKRHGDQRDQYCHDTQVQEKSDAYTPAHLAESGYVTDAVYPPDD